MCAWTTHPTVVTGQTWTAANHNTYIKDNLDEIWKGTTAGDIDYYTSGTAKSRLAKGTNGQLLRMNSGATAPEWGGLQFATVINGSTQTLTNGVYTALTFDTTGSDVFNWHDSGTPSRFTVNVTGQYILSWFYEHGGASGTGTYTHITEVRRDGSVLVRERLYLDKDANNKFFTNTFGPFSMNSGQYVEVYVNQSSGADKTTVASPAARMSITRIA